MKTISRMLMLFVLGVVLVTPSPSIAKTPKTVDRTVIGFVSDNHCGLKHVAGMGDDKSCTLMCIKDGKGKLVLADRAHKRVYNLDKTGQEKALEFAGQKVKVTGRVTGRTIHVMSIEATS